MSNVSFRTTAEADQQIDELLARFGDKTSLMHAAIQALHRRHFPASIYGFVKVIPGDFDLYRPEDGDDPERCAQCPDCGQPFTSANVYLSFHSDGTFAPICGSCVADFNG
jgi:hypothetical protein